MMKKLLSALSRPATSNSIIPEMEGLRFVAIISVLSLHMGTQILRISPDLNTTGDWVYRIISAGDLGVKVFFTISGFILAYPFAQHYLLCRPGIPVQKFYLKRLTRLEPPFIINILLLFALQLVITQVSFMQLLPHFLTTITYTHYFIYGTWSTINPVTWSLETEVQFYLLAPFICYVLYAIKKRSIRIAVIAAIIVSLGSIHVNTYEFLKKWHVLKSLPNYLDNFLTGILFLEIYLMKGFYHKLKPSTGWDVATITGLVLLFYVSYQLPPFWSIALINASIFLLFLGVFKGRFSNKIFTYKIITVVGGMCYTIYLYHYAMFFILSKYTAKIPVHSNQFWVQFFAQGVCMLVAVIVACSLLFYWFEKPFMIKNWYRQRTGVKKLNDAII